MDEEFFRERPDRQGAADDLPLRPAHRPDEGQGLSWDAPELPPESTAPLYDPLPAASEPPAPPVARTAPKGGVPLVRIVLPVAALIALVFLSRGLWWPEEPKPRQTAPEWVAAPHLPAEAVPPLAASAEPPVIEEETGPEVAEPEPAADNYEILQTEELAGRDEIPEPPREEIAAAEPAPSAETPVVAQDEPEVAPEARREAPPNRLATLPRRALPPAPWETGNQPEGLLRPGPGVQEPIPLDLPRYNYPQAARGTGLEVIVRLALLVDERGQVIDAVVREGGPEDLGFDREALRVARKIPFQPATRNDIPGKMWTEMILEFAEPASGR